MTVPTYDQFIAPLLHYLAQRPDGVRTADAHEAIANALGLTPDDRAQRVPSGVQPIYKNRNGWAHDRLKRAGLSTSPRQGFWRLTPDGQKYAAANRTLSDEELDRLSNVDRSLRLRPKKDATDDAASTPELGSTTSAKASPEERIEAALAELRDSVGRDLLENIGRAPPEFFEQLVLDLLHAMGYGTSRAALQRVGGSGDGGIDGIISLDRLGLEKVYVQAKRWKNTVGSPEVQGFMGALQLQAASKGVFITTSAFTRDAKEAAARARGSIVLVDGAQLSTLMMDHGVGVSHKALRVPKVDGDYFEDV
ncbi:Mrr restriction system protein [Labilithrix luteola]|uniref:Mrr restriction system protein n=1 Tax=Labilithrix luteola TaxID=1391654 RepID=A0A0K1QF01_9BACT|nr:restriction endonuclease [Labilithrix luteola]AKV04344.1 Mrr restriction system protein [Labilithrix luteola]